MKKRREGIFPRPPAPFFHLTPWIGWMNDPNGFSYYQGQYHLFYQYNPYDTQWDAMHWGHAVSPDLLHWTYLPASLAPDAPYDSFGCFSGSAIELPDGKQLLLYTGVRKEGGDKGEGAADAECGCRGWAWNTPNTRRIPCWMPMICRRG